MLPITILKKKNILDVQGPYSVSLEMLIKFTSRFINKKVKIVEKNKKNCSIRLIDSTLSNKIM